MRFFTDFGFERVMSLVGLFSFIGIAWLMSSHKSRINWRIVIGGLILQLVFAVVVFESRKATFPDADGIARFPDGIVFAAIDGGFQELGNWVNEGAGMLFNVYPSPEDDAEKFPTTPVLLRSFAFGVLPTVIFFSALMSVLYYLGIMQRIVKWMAFCMQRTLGTSGAESLAAAANVFVGHTQAPLVVKPFVGRMTISELNALMIGGFATITGGLMAVYVGMGINAGHLLTASVISAPAALLIAKVLLPETEKSETESIESLSAIKSTEPIAVNVIEAAAKGASEGMKLAINIGAMLIAFLALVAMVNALLGGLGEVFEWISESVTGREIAVNWSLQGIFSYVFSPFAFLMGIQPPECLSSGELLGTKIVINEFVAYADLGQLIPDADGNVAEGKVALSERTQIIMTYALSGFSNFGAIAIQLGGIGGLAPERSKDLAKLGLRAMFGGMIACCMTGCVAGMLL